MNTTNTENKKEMYIPITIEELRLGDEFLMASGSNIISLIALKEPKLSQKRKLWSDRSKFAYISLRCSHCVETYTNSYTDYNGQVRTYTREKYGIDFENHNRIKNFDLDGKQLFLIKRKNDLNFD